MRPEVADRSRRFKEEVSDKERNDALDTDVEVIVVARRCVYIANHRVAGGKPYVSENLPQHTLQTTLGQVLAAFSDAEILKAVADRQYNRELVRAWQVANPYTPPQD